MSSTQYAHPYSTQHRGPPSPRHLRNEICAEAFALLYTELQVLVALVATAQAEPRFYGWATALSIQDMLLRTGEPNASVSSLLAALERKGLVEGRRVLGCRLLWRATGRGGARVRE